MKKVFVLVLALACFVGLYAFAGRLAGGGGSALAGLRLVGRVAPVAATDPGVVVTGTPWACAISTGLAGGTVNLRACGSVGCAVVGILDEGQRVVVLAAGDWLNVQTGEGVTGYVNSTFCK